MVVQSDSESGSEKKEKKAEKRKSVAGKKKDPIKKKAIRLESDDDSDFDFGDEDWKPKASNGTKSAPVVCIESD